MLRLCKAVKVASEKRAGGTILVPKREALPTWEMRTRAGDADAIASNKKTKKGAKG